MNVLCATKGDRQPQGLEHVPALGKVLTSQAKPWAVAANELLEQASGFKQGALFVDDDITILPHTFDAFDTVKDKADVIGFTLFNGAGDAVISAGYVMHCGNNGVSGPLPQREMLGLFSPVYVAHVTASCMWLSPRALQELRFPIWPGQHHEDVAFTFDAWIKGLKVAYVPGAVLHHVTEANIGATKGVDPAFAQASAVNRQCLDQWIAQHEVARHCAEGRIPVGAVPL